MHTKYLLLYFLISYVEGTTYQLSGDSVVAITCTYNDECATEDIIIYAESGYKVLITVKEVDIDGTSGDFLLIKSGTIIEDGLTGRVFTHQIKQEREYISLTEEVLIHFVVKGENANNHQGFVLTAEHYGEPLTTVEPTVTEKAWPTPSEDEVPYITTTLSVEDESNATVSNFQNFVVRLATDYVEANDFHLAEPISEDNVQINTINKCPMFWPNSSKCLQFTFAVPIIMSEESQYYGTYQLNSTNLANMWQNASQYIIDSYYGIYKEPDNTYVIIIWMSIICSTIILFGIIYLASGYGYVLKKKKITAEKKKQPPPEEAERNSITSLSPHPLQHIPQLFDTDVTYYNPDSPGDIVRNSGRKEHDDNRDTLDTVALNLRVFSFSGQDLEEVTET